jgi:hypothetical protein
MFPILDMVPSLLRNQSFYPTSMATGGQDLTTYKPDLTLPCAPAWHVPETPVAMSGGLQYQASDPRAGVLEWHSYLMPDNTRHNHRTTYKRSHYPSSRGTKSRPPFIHELVELSAHPL